MKAREADELGEKVVASLQNADVEEALSLLEPLLNSHTPFRELDRVGARIGTLHLDFLNPLLVNIARQKTEGGWVIIGSSLRERVDHNLTTTLEICREFIRIADVWYAAGILGERALAEALILRFEETLKLLTPWREDPNRWVRRAIGHGVHVWAKRSRGQVRLIPQAEALLQFLTPLFGERDMDAIKGIAWGLKTLGKYYPDQVAIWLRALVSRDDCRYHRLMLRKAISRLPDNLKKQISEVADV